MRITKLSMMLLGALSLAALLNGCGSSSKESAISAGDIAKVNEATCLGCHASWTEKITGDAIVANYNASKHNLNYVGCQDCHGGGSMHSGVGPMPYPQPGSAQCATCHTTITPAFVNGNHGPANFTIEFAEDEARRICSRCHTHEGALLGGASGYTGDLATLKANAGKAPGLDPDGSKSQGMKCVTCHVTHKTDELREPNTVVAGAVVPWQPATMVGGGTASTNKQFNLCTSCHNYTTTDGKLIANGNNGTAEYYHSTSWYRIVGATHWDDPATPDVVEGYVLRTSGPNSANPCYDCHAHEAKAGTRYGSTTTPSIYTDWARSGHAGGLLDAKYAAAKANPQTGTRGTAEYTTTGKAQVDAVMAAGATLDSGAAWVDEGGVGAGSSCARCHTSTGAASYLSSPSTYSAAALNFSHRTAGQKEMLYCWGCHSDAAAGVVRTPGAISVTYTAGTTITYADAKASNSCISCHSGRQVGDDISNSTGNFTNFAETRPHYLATAGIVFAKTGYEFGTRDYTIPASDQHDKLGMGVATGNATYDAVRGNYTNGPCVSCHMTSANYDGTGSHTFSPLTKYSANDLALNPICVNCHSTRGAGTNAAVTWLGYTTASVSGATHKSRYLGALEALREQLAADGFHYRSGRHYTDITFATQVRNWGTKDNMGAAFNYNLMINEPAGVAHNRRYTQRLIYDSIDWLDNGVLDYSVFATLNALDPATAPYKDNAINYLINRGTNDANVGTVAERK